MRSKTRNTRLFYIYVAALFLSLLFLDVRALGKGTLTDRIPTDPKTEPDKRVKEEAPAETSGSMIKSYRPGQLRNFDDLSIAEDHVTGDDLEFENFALPAAEDKKSLIDRANELYEIVNDEQRFADFLDETALVDLPIGIIGKNKEGQTDYAILIDSLVVTPNHAYLVAFMTLPIPQTDKRLTFMATNVKFSHKGGITGDARLQLLEDVAFNLPGDKSQVIIRADEGKTYVNWDCNGFKSMAVDADVVFSRDWLLREKADGTVDRSGRVSGQFETVIDDWNNLVAQVSLEPFQISGLQGVGFYVDQAVFDFSDIRNASNVKFPEGYDSPMFIDGNQSMWRGFYLKEMKVKLPPAFKTKGQSARKELFAKNVLIDNMGFTGTIGGANLIGKKNGDMNGWAFSLDTISFDLQSNEIKEAGFNGELIVPVAGESQPFKYNAVINPGNEYLFSLEYMSQVDFEVWKAKVEILEGSAMDIQYRDGKFIPKVSLNGKMTIGADDDVEMSLVDISFERLQILSEKPYLKIGDFSFGSKKLQSSMEGFPLSINDIGLRKISDQRVGLGFTVMVSLTGEGDGGFGGDATLEVIGAMDENEGYQSWRYSSVRVSELGVDINGGSFQISGRIKLFRDDAIYGSGFNGQVQAHFEPGFDVSGTAIFGKVDGYRYFFTDAMVSLPYGIPAFYVLSFYGFGGGIYHNMDQLAPGETGGSPLGQTLSGLVYVPNKEVKYGFKATVQLGLTSSKETFNADVTYEMSFNRGGGINQISLTGNAYVMADMEIGDNYLTDLVATMEEGNMASIGELKKKGMISGHTYMSWDFTNDTMYGLMEMYIDVLGGVIRGSGPQGLAARVEILFAPDNWYILAGTPDRRMGLEVLKIAKFDSYMMVGKNIPGSPPPHENVSEILGGIDLDYMRDENALGTGKGLAFGGGFHIDTGDITFLVFYARFRAGMGFDNMIKDYGEARCSNSSGPIGINGWYMNGQAYAYFEGKIGIKFKLFGSSKRKEILSIGAAAVGQMKFPNPTWFRFIVGGRYSILGGLIRGACNFEVEIGEQCKIVNGSVLSSVQVISDVTPANLSKDVSVFTSPQAVFNIPVNRVFSLVDLDDKRKSFRVKLEHFRVMDGSREIPARLEWNSTNDVVAYNTIDVLPPHKKLKLQVEVSFEESVDRGQWSAVKVSGKKLTEKMEAEFTSGAAPDHIPLNNVAYSYPQLNQYNLYKDEVRKGYIKLIKGQPYLFNVSNEWRQTGRFRSADGHVVEFGFNYNNQQISFNIPTSLRNEKLYAFEIANVPRQTGLAVDRNVQSVSNKVAIDEQTIDTEITTKEAKGFITDLEEKLVFQGFTRTSKYNTFDAKINSFSIHEGISLIDHRGQAIHELVAPISGVEYMDMAELKGINNMPPMIQLEANLENNNWYHNYIYPLVYADVPFVPGMNISDKSLGVPPVKAVYLEQDNEDQIVTEDDVIRGYSVNAPTSAEFSYQLDYYIKKHYIELQAQTANYIRTDAKLLTPRMRYILENPYPVIKKEYYRIDFKYVLPGTDKVTTTRYINILNPFDYK